MPVYTVKDEETNKTITFDWFAPEEPTEKDMAEIFAQAGTLEPTAKGPGFGRKFVGGMAQTAQNIGRVYPAAETAASVATSLYGLPASGLAGLFALPFGLEKSAKTVEAVQKGLVYQPQTRHGKELTEATMLPFTALARAGEYAGGKVEEAGYPMLGATVETAIEAAPLIMGARAGIKPSPTKALLKIDREMNVAIDAGITKAIRPSVVGKTTETRIAQYRDKARTTVKEIIANKENLNLLDEKGARVEGLPQNLDQFTQAIEQTKRGIFEEYDGLAAATGKAGIEIDLKPIAKELQVAMESKTLQDLSPETIAYAKKRIKALTRRDNYTAVETQEAIQLLNQTLEKFYRDPSPAMKGQSLVDSLIANRLRQSLDDTIQRTTGKDYQVLKNKYGALRTIEKDVVHRSIIDARRNNKGLLDFTDVFSGYHIIRGVLTAEPVSVAAGIGSRVISAYYKMLNNPNRIVKNMFSDVETSMGRMEAIKAKITAGQRLTPQEDIRFAKYLEDIEERSPVSPARPREYGRLDVDEPYPHYGAGTPLEQLFELPPEALPPGIEAPPYHRLLKYAQEVELPKFTEPLLGPPLSQEGRLVTGGVWKPPVESGIPRGMIAIAGELERLPHGPKQPPITIRNASERLKGRFEARIHVKWEEAERWQKQAFIDIEKRRELLSKMRRGR